MNISPYEVMVVIIYTTIVYTIGYTVGMYKIHNHTMKLLKSPHLKNLKVNEIK